MGYFLIVIDNPFLCILEKLHEKAVELKLTVYNPF